MFSDNVQYQIREPVNVLLLTNEEKQLPEGVFMVSKLSTSIERKMITTLLGVNDNVVKIDKVACITEMVLSLDDSTTLTTWKTEDSATSYLGIT